MAGWFIAFLVFGAITLVFIVPWFAISRSWDRDDSSGRFAANIMLPVCLGIVGLTFFLSSFKIVGAKDIGVPVTFGKPDCKSLMHNGWNWKAPATAVHVFDGALQTEKFSSDKDDQGDPVPVRLFTGSVANVNITFQWKLENDNNVCQVYNNYREPDKINTNLVKRALQQSLNEVFASYNPYSALIAAQTAANGTNGTNTTTNVPGTQQVATSFEDLQASALSKLKSELAPQGVSAISLTIASIQYDDGTQDNLNKLGTAITQTQIALQNEKTASATAEANRLLNSQPANNQTIQQLCIQATEKMAESGHLPNAGWNCMGGSTVIPQAK